MTGAPYAPDPGLCGRCRHRRIIGTRKGSRFYFCERSLHDPRYRRYPPLPVLSCEGFEKERDAGATSRPVSEES